MAKFSLAALTVLELAPPEMIELAARCGYEKVGLRLLPATPGGIAYPPDGRCAAAAGDAGAVGVDRA